MIRVLTYGTYDMFHIGHLNFLKQARALGDHLTVAVSTDEFNRQKDKTAIIPYKDRIEIVSAIKYVNVVMPEDSWDQKIEDVKTNHIDIFVIGDDWRHKFDFLLKYCEVIYLPRTPNISSTKLKELIQLDIS